MVSLVRVGEITGRLDEVFLRLYEYLEFEKKMREDIKAALRYPMFVVVALAVAMVIVNIFVIPAFAKIFASFKTRAAADDAHPDRHLGLLRRATGR